MSNIQVETTHPVPTLRANSRGWTDLARTAPSGGSVLFTDPTAAGTFLQAVRNVNRVPIGRSRTKERDGEQGFRVWVTDGEATTKVSP